MSEIIKFPKYIDDAPPIVKEMILTLAGIAAESISQTMREEYPDADISTLEWRQLAGATFHVAEQISLRKATP